MEDFNVSSISGRLTKDSEFKQVNETGILEFSLASNNNRGDKEETLFLDCTLFGDRGKKLSEYLLKGKPIIASGRLRQENWESDSGKRSKISLIVQNVTFLPEKQ